MQAYPIPDTKVRYQPSIPPSRAAENMHSVISMSSSTSGEALRPDRVEVESLLLNMNASLRVYERHHFFDWTQGLLQNLVKHELLVCALRGARSMSFEVDSFATPPLDPVLFEDLFRRDTLLVPHLIKAWEDNHFGPVLCSIGNIDSATESRFAQELEQIGIDSVIAHGTYDGFGKLVSFFTFACRSPDVGSKQIYFAELIVPFLHLAWSRFQAAQVRRSAEGAGINPVRGEALSSRQQEILKWIHQGKSNAEIGMILEISPLTVKNHVQKILQKLNVRNRAQAVGKALALRILSL